MNIEHKACQKLVDKFVRNPVWPREMKLAKRLLAQSPDIDAWMALDISLVPSLAYFLSEVGQVYIPQSQQNPYLLDLDKLQPKSKKD